MSGLFAVLLIGSLIAFGWGLIAPGHLSKTARIKRPVSRRRFSVVLGLVAAFFFVLTGVAAPQQPPTAQKTIVQVQPASAQKQDQIKQDQVTTKQETVTEQVPFDSVTQDDAKLPKGQTKVVQQGVEGVKTLRYTVTYTNGVEKGRELAGSAITTQPVKKITAVGTYVAPAPTPAPTPTPAVSCSNGSYINSAGNRVCSPEASSGVPAGATARCGDGTYSFSQSRSGTCSHHGGVASWL